VLAWVMTCRASLAGVASGLARCCSCWSRAGCGISRATARRFSLWRPPVPAGAETTVEDVEDVEDAGPEDDSILAADSAVVIGSTAGFGLVDAGVGTEVDRHRTHAGSGCERHLVVGVVRKRGEPRSLPLV